MFGPPQRFTIASTCSWLGHQVSGLRQDTSHPVQIRFRFGSVPLTLNLASHRNSPARSTKSTTSHCFRIVLCLLVSTRFQVLFHSPPGVLFTFPSRYCSLSVIWSYLALWDGPHVFRQNSSCSDVLRILLALPRFRLRDCHPLRSVFQYSSGLGSSDFARHYFRNRFYFLFLRVLRCFSSPGSPRIPMDSVCDNTTLLVLSSLIRRSADLKMFAPPRSFSQLTTSFFGAIYQGILRALFVA